jgi:hypothetical protein
MVCGDDATFHYQSVDGGGMGLYHSYIWGIILPHPSDENRFQFIKSKTLNSCSEYDHDDVRTFDVTDRIGSLWGDADDIIRTDISGKVVKFTVPGEYYSSVFSLKIPKILPQVESINDDNDDDDDDDGFFKRKY